MIRSHVVDVDGVFVGAAVCQEDGWRFVAVDDRVEPLDGGVWPTPGHIQRLARAALFRAQPLPVPG
jgi:hypothetical protein